MCQRREPTNKTCSFLPPLFGPLSFSFSQNRKIQGLKNLAFGAQTKEQNMEKLAMHACDDYLFMRKKKICFRRYHYQVRIITIKLH